MDQSSLFLVAICILYIVVFGEASLAKFIARETPEWFVDTFKATWLGKFPIPPQYWLIASLELATALVFVAALATAEPFLARDAADGIAAFPTLIGYGLLLASLVFTMLCLGLRVSTDFAGAASAFAYAALSLLLWTALNLLW